MLNLTHTKTFLAVLSERGFRAAARELKLAPATVLDHMNQLEAELAAPLIVRRRGAVEPTIQGAAFVPLARALIETAERSRALIAGAPLRVAASSNIGTYLLQSALASFQAADRRPVELWIGANPDVADRLQGGGADVALMEWWDDRPGFAARTWQREPLVLIVAPDHPWAKRRTVAARDLIGQTFLGGEAGTGTATLLLAKLGPSRPELTTVGGFGSTEAVKRAVRAGRGISIVMAAAVADEIKAGQLVAIRLRNIDIVKETKVILPAGAPATAPAARFAAHVLRHTRG